MTYEKKLKVAFLGENPNFKSALLSTEKAYAQSGNNVGNHAFWNAVDSHFENERCYLNSWSFDSRYVKNNFDLLVIPASNFIHPDRDMGALAKKIEETKLPLLVIGLGAQAVDAESDIVLKDGTKRFISVIKDQALHITCRGDYTKSILDAFGCKNTSSLGCPSNLTNLNPNLGVDVKKKLISVSNSQNNISIILNIDSHRRKFFKEYVSLISLLENDYYKVVCQNPIELVKLARGDNDIVNSSHIEFQKKLWAGAIGSTDFSSFARDYFVTFFNANHWMEYSRSFDLSLGTRLHGNMLAFQAEVPTIFLSHDSRTSELVDIMKLPSSKMSGLSLDSKSEIFDNVNFDGALYDSNRKRLSKKYVQILQESGLIVTSSLKRFADEY